MFGRQWSENKELCWMILLHDDPWEATLHWLKVDEIDSGSRSRRYPQDWLHGCVWDVSAPVDTSLRGLTVSWWGFYGLCHKHKLTKLAHSFLFCSCVCFCLYGPFHSISFHKFSRTLFAFSLCSSGLISALLVLSTIHLFMKVSLSPDVILCGWLGLKHQLTN